MAGIGFVLRRLSRQDNLLGLMQAYVYSALISTGPWMFTILSLGSITFLAGKFTSIDVLSEFRRVIIYNFAFSLVFSAPIFMVVTRYLADAIYAKDVKRTPGLLIGGTLLMFGTQLPPVLIFYFGYANINPALAFAATINFLLISEIWLISVFVTALKDYKTVTLAFGLGMGFSALSSAFLVETLGLIGLLTSFSLGLCIIIALLVARILAEYPYRFEKPFDFIQYFPRYWEVAAAGVTYNSASWVDKWIMWFAPEGDHSPTGLFLYPNYDSAMFLAYLSIVPSMAMFIMSVETSFFEAYLRFYRDIQNKAPLSQIRRNHKAILDSLIKSARNFLVIQGSVSVICILLASKIFLSMGINFMQISIFRFGVLGSFFQVLTLFVNIVLSYFDCRSAYLKLQGFFLVSNGVFTVLFLMGGFRFYGMGFFFASVATFVVSASYMMYYLLRLPYHTFVTTNASVNSD
ncbi:MAG: exopolysaccharide Pel transporter PelG [bacterium]|nr:exopolysaccharide Pel transporter PelG [bacterium]